MPEPAAVNSDVMPLVPNGRPVLAMPNGPLLEPVPPVRGDEGQQVMAALHGDALHPDHMPEPRSLTGDHADAHRIGSNHGHADGRGLDPSNGPGETGDTGHSPCPRRR